MLGEGGVLDVPCIPRELEPQVRIRLCAGSRIRTCVAVRHQIYSLTYLTALPSQQSNLILTCGAETGNRTQDPVLTKNVLCQLSYLGESRP